MRDRGRKKLRKAHNSSERTREEEGRKFIAKKSHSSPLICRRERYYSQDKRREKTKLKSKEKIIKKLMWKIYSWERIE